MIRFVILFAALFFSVIFNAQTIRVNDQASLNDAITNIQPGDTILLETAGSPYIDLEIVIKAEATAEFPITIAAESTGNVLLTGNSKIRIGGAFIKVEGFVFGGNYAPNDLIGDGVIEFRSTTSESDWCNNCKVSDIAFIGHNQSEDYKEQKLKWVRIYGEDNEVSNCTFINKYGVGNCITVERASDTENRALIHHNYFAERTPVLDNGNTVLNDQDAMRIGYSGTSLSDAYCEVYNNFFHNWDGEAEIISNKSCRNKYYNNTFRNCVGTLTLRHGTHCEIYSNFFFGEDHVKSGGIRVIDSDHFIYNNYFQDLNSGTSKVVGAINLFKGDEDFVIGGNLTSYAICEDVTVAYNTIVNCDKGLWIGPDDSGREYEPQNLELSNNIMINCDDAVLIGDVAPSGTNTITGNIKNSGDWWSGFDTDDNLSTSQELTEFDGIFHRLMNTSEAIGYAYDLLTFNVTNDITGGARDGDPDSGAEEFTSGGTFIPYEYEDVGITVGARYILPSNIEDLSSSDDIFKIFPNPAKDKLYIEFVKTIKKITIYSYTGKQIKIFKTVENVIDISELLPGAYIISILGEEHSQSQYFIKL